MRKVLSVLLDQLVVRCLGISRRRERLGASLPLRADSTEVNGVRGSVQRDLPELVRLAVAELEIETGGSLW